MALLLALLGVNAAYADCPAAPIDDPNDLALSFLKANGAQIASASLLASSIKQGTLVYDGTANKLKLCDGSNWVAVGTGAGTDTLASLSCAAGEIVKFNGTAWACAEDGGGSGGTQVAFSAEKSSAQSLSVGWTKVIWDSTSFNVGNGFANSRFTPNVAGKYQINGNIRFNASVDNNIGTAIYKNGVVHHYSVNNNTAASLSSASISDVIDMNGTTDYLELWAWASLSTSVYTIGIADNSFSGILISGGSGGSDTLAGLSCATNEIPKWNGTAWACAAEGGGDGSPSDAFTVTKTSVQTLASVGTLIDWQNVITNVGGHFDLATDKFTAATAGNYYFHASLLTDTDATTGDFSIFKNGINTGLRSFAGTVVSYKSAVAQGVLTLAAGDTVDVRTNAAGSTLYGGAGSSVTTFTGFRVGGGSGGGSDTLASLSCATNEIPKWNGTAWACAAEGGGMTTGQIAAFASATCPAGWAEYLPARGRFLRGIDPSGSTAVDAAGIRAPGGAQEGSLVMMNHGGSDSRVFNLHSPPTAAFFDKVQGSGNTGFGGNWISITPGAIGNWGAGNLDPNFVGVARPRNVAVIFCQYSGSGGGGGSGSITLTGDVTGSGTGSVATTITDSIVSYAKLQNTSAASVLLGRGAGSGAGVVQELTIGAGLSLGDTTLSATASGTVSGTTNYVAKFTGTSTVGNSQIFDDGTNVGIGTATPSVSLEIGNFTSGNGTVRINRQDTSGNEGGELRFAAGTNGDDSFYFDNYLAGANQIFRIRSTTNPSIINIAKGGNIGIGTATPTASLDVAGSMNITQSPAYDVWIQGGGYGTGSARRVALLGERAEDRLWLNYYSDYTGGVVIGGPVYLKGVTNAAYNYPLCISGSEGFVGYAGACSASDERMKESIVRVSGALDKIMTLRGVTFDWKDAKRKKNDGRQMGLIAQDVDKVFPEAVIHNRPDKMLALNYDSMAGAFVEAIRELKIDNDNLRAELRAANDNDAAQNVAIDALRQEIKTLKAVR